MCNKTFFFCFLNLINSIQKIKKLTFLVHFTIKSIFICLYYFTHESGIAFEIATAIAPGPIWHDTERDRG